MPRGLARAGLLLLVSWCGCSGFSSAAPAKGKEKGYYLPPAMTGNLNPDAQRSFPTSMPAGDLTGAYSPNAASLLNGQPITSPVSPVPTPVMRGIAAGLPSPQGVDMYHPILPQPPAYIPPTYPSAVQAQLLAARGQVPAMNNLGLMNAAPYQTGLIQLHQRQMLHQYGLRQLSQRSTAGNPYTRRISAYGTKRPKRVSAEGR